MTKKLDDLLNAISKRFDIPKDMIKYNVVDSNYWNNKEIGISIIKRKKGKLKHFNDKFKEMCRGKSSKETKDYIYFYEQNIEEIISILKLDDDAIQLWMELYDIK